MEVVQLECNTNNHENDLPEELVIEIPEKLEVTLTSEKCIFRVPTSISSVNEAAYSPKLISIGPIHHGKPELQNMEIQKLRYLKLFCQRLEGNMTEKQVVDHLSGIIKECELMIRQCYEEPCKLSSKKFVKMMLLDAVFIMEFFMRGSKLSGFGNDFIIGQPSAALAILWDLILLENQIPYFLVKFLYDGIMSPINSDDFDTLASGFLRLPEQLASSSLLRKVEHLLEVQRYSILLTSKVDYKVRGNSKLKYSSAKLHQAGVKFEALPRISKDEIQLDVEFTEGVLKMPVLEVRDYFEVKYRNLMALEQRHYPFESHICNFFFLMDNLINTAEDVELLVDAGIIVHWHGSNQILADFFNKLCKGMSTEHDTCYASLNDKLNKHYENKWNHRKATLRLVYFSNLWRGTGTVAATLLLLMTFIQTYCSMKSLKLAKY